MSRKRGSRGSLTFIIPDKLDVYSVDMRDAEREPTPLYKEWRFAGPLTTRGSRSPISSDPSREGHGMPRRRPVQVLDTASIGTRGRIRAVRVAGRTRRAARHGAPPVFPVAGGGGRHYHDLLRREDWPTLARYYDLTGSSIPLEALTSGRFFLNAARPPSGHPGLPWKYRHPFTPGFTFTEVRPTAVVDVVAVTVGISIDEGGGRIRRGFSEFRMRKSTAGYQVLPDSWSD